MPVRLVALLSLLAACSEYEFIGEDGNPDPTNDTDDPCPLSIPDCEDSGGFDSGGGPGPTDECSDQVFYAADLSQVEECAFETQTGTWTPIIEWTSTAPGDAYTTPVVCQLTDDNGDGAIDDADTPDVVVGGSTGRYYALNGDTGTTIWSAGTTGSEPMTAACGDVDGDGKPDVVGGGASATQAYNGQTGAVLWSVAAYSGSYTGQCGAVGLYDLDGNNSVEVVIGNWILNGRTGATIGKGAHGGGSGHGWAAPMGAAADVDQDGDLEVVVGNALYDATGATIWYNGQSDGFVAVADFDGDAYGEIVVANTGSLRLQDHDGTVLWNKAGLTGSTIGPPTVADFDGDGKPEIGVAGNGVYIVVNGEDGSLLWRNNVQDYSSGFTGSAVFDFEGDGSAEVVYADENDVWVFDGATGATKLKESTHSSATCSEYPAVADVDGDGHAEIIYTSSAYSGSERGVRVIGDADDSWQAARPIWNQHAYAITNVESDGSISPTPDTNWLTYNNFRSGDILSGQGGAAPDLVVSLDDVCRDECEAGKIIVWARVGNQGYADVAAGVELSLEGRRESGWVLLDTVAVDTIPAGRMLESVEFTVEGISETDPFLDLRVSVDGGNEAGRFSLVAECDETNNEDDWGEDICW
jgi:outer membrane protein assembly factor BamB